MVQAVSYQSTLFNSLPYRLEAGTPHIEGAIGLAAACDFLQAQDRQAILAWEQKLARHVHQTLANYQARSTKIKLFSTEKSTMVSFLVTGIHCNDLSGYLDSKGIAVRTGLHCAHPLMAELGINGTIRASFACYNTQQEADYFITTLLAAIDLLAD